MAGGLPRQGQMGQFYKVEFNARAMMAPLGATYREKTHLTKAGALVAEPYSYTSGTYGAGFLH
jgi:hypothetical protein